MANALDDIVHESRFQPTNLAHLLYELFPTEGGSVPRATHPATSVSHGSASSSLSLRSPTVPPISRTASGAGAQRFDAVDPPSLKPKSSFKGIFFALIVLAGGGAAGWKVFGKRLTATHAAVVSDPSRRFFVYIKSDPPGANIYRVEGSKLMGATPITLPVDLNGVSSFRIRLEKPGYEKYEQIIANDQPISISLTELGAAPAHPVVPDDAVPAAVPAPGEAPAPGGAPGTKPAAPKPAAHPHHHAAPKAPAPKPDDDTSAAPSGEIE
jgi:hypothetical protein